MNSGQRIGLLGAALAVLAIAFFALSPTDSSNDTASTPTTPETTAAQPPPAPPTATEPAVTATEPPAPAATTTEPGTTGGTAPTTTTDGTGGTIPTTTTDGTGGTTAAPEPVFTTIRVRGGKPVGGVKTIQTRSGERVRIQVTSTDTSDEVHLHGYDIARDVKPGKPARFSFEAEAEGIFEIELEGSHTQIAKLEVRPR